MPTNHEFSRTFCNCTGAPPWPGMARLAASVARPDRYFVCPECGAIREEICRADGSIEQVRWHTRDQWEALPAMVAEQARRTLDEIEPDMVIVAAGECVMGSTPAELEAALEDCTDSKREWYLNEQPQHRVCLPEFAIARTPVTNIQYRRFVRATGRSLPAHWLGGRLPAGQEDHPVTGVSWHEANSYCQWLSESTGKAYRLPSEAQWEKAARGADGRTYPWGNEFQPGMCNCSEIGLGYTTPVGVFASGASPYGALDMAGNVWEWTSSLFKEYPYTAQDGREALDSGEQRALRGGAFFYNRYDVRCAVRSRYRPEGKHYLVGFRPALDLEAGNRPL